MVVFIGFIFLFEVWLDMRLLFLVFFLCKYYLSLHLITLFLFFSQFLSQTVLLFSKLSQCGEQIFFTFLVGSLYFLKFIYFDTSNIIFLLYFIESIFGVEIVLVSQTTANVIDLSYFDIDGIDELLFMKIVEGHTN